jgi:hypothetical protein
MSIGFNRSPEVVGETAVSVVSWAWAIPREAAKMTSAKAIIFRIRSPFVVPMFSCDIIYSFVGNDEGERWKGLDRKTGLKSLEVWEICPAQLFTRLNV